MNNKDFVFSDAYRDGWRDGWSGRNFPEVRNGDRDYTTGYVIGRDRKVER